VSNDRQKFIRQCMLAIVQGHYANPESGAEKWTTLWQEATEVADCEPLQPEPEPQPEHTREDWWELEGDLKRLRKDVQRLSANTETLEGRIRRGVAVLRAATRYDRAQGYMVPEDAVDEAIQILEEGSDD
jgi:hypothetical protein